MIIWLVYIFLDALLNWWLIERKNYRPDHVYFTIVRGLFCAVIGRNIGLEGWNESAVFVLFCASSFWVVFDIALNLLRKKDWDYIGVKDGKDAISDSFGLEHPKLFWVSKIIAFFLALYLALRYIYA